jgi:hypothetical protein
MAAPDHRKRPGEQSSNSPSDGSESDCKKTGKGPEEIEPLDEKILERVMRDCPL